MSISPSELWEMDGEELQFWYEGLLAISEAENGAAEAD